MPQPSNSTITIDGDKFNALSADVSPATLHDHTGMPMMGSVQCAIEVTVDLHDTENMPYSILNKIYTLANGVTRDKVKDIKIAFWTDESQADAICTYSFQGWISQFSTGSGGGSNHTLNLSLQPMLQREQYIKVDMGN